MSVKSPLQLRWNRAQAIPDSDVRKLSDTEYYVHSQSRNGGYLACVHLSEGKLVQAECDCPDYVGMAEAKAKLEAEGKPVHKGIPVLHGMVVCKHVLAAAIRATK